MRASDIIMGLIFLAGVLLFGLWLLKTSLGREALADSMPRRNSMALYIPFIPLFIWLGPLPLAIQITERLSADLKDWQKAFLFNLVYCFGAIVVVVVIIFLVRAGFARKLKGFGFCFKSIYKDFFMAFLNILAVWPLMMGAIALTIYFCKLVFGQEYQISQHEQLELITVFPQWQLRILVIAVAVIIAPVLEEMLFRGLFQTVIRSFLESRNSNPNQSQDCLISLPERRNRAWESVFISSGLFAVMHVNMPHWPALFLLGMCLGYAYEKSGSLFRPIFIHAFFNAVTILFVLLEV